MESFTKTSRPVASALRWATFGLPLRHGGHLRANRPRPRCRVYEASPSRISSRRWPSAAPGKRARRSRLTASASAIAPGSMVPLDSIARRSARHSSCIQSALRAYRDARLKPSSVRRSPSSGRTRWNIPVERHPAAVSRRPSPGEKEQGKAEPPHPAPRRRGASAKPEKRGVGPAGSGWLVARVPLAWSTEITSGPQSAAHPMVGPRLARKALRLP